MSFWWEGDRGWSWEVSACEGASSLYGSYASWPPTVRSSIFSLQPLASSCTALGTYLSYDSLAGLYWPMSPGL